MLSLFLGATIYSYEGIGENCEKGLRLFTSVGSLDILGEFRIHVHAKDLEEASRCAIRDARYQEEPC